MKCLDCSVADLKTALTLHPKMVRHRFVKCPIDIDPYRFSSLHFERECATFKPAVPGSAAKRIRILNDRNFTEEE